MTAGAAPTLPDWGQSTASGHKRLDPTLLVALTLALLIGGGLWALIGPIPGLVTAVVLVAASVLWRTGRSKKVLRSLGAEPIQPLAAPRLTNIVEGLASDLGITAPSLWRIHSDDRNALVVGGGKPAVAVTEGLHEASTRTELEAVIAHCLVRIARAKGGAIPPVSAADDVSAAAVTRYPPALAAAVTKATPRPEKGAERWFVPASGAASPDERAQELLDL
jgi:hypothetical protein